MKSFLTKKITTIASIGTIIAGGTATAAIVVATTESRQMPKTLAISSIDDGKSKFVYDAISDPSSISSMLHPDFNVKTTDITNKLIGGHKLNVVKRVNSDAVPISEIPVIINYDQISKDLEIDPAFANASPSLFKKEYWKRLSAELAKANEALYNVIQDKIVNPTHDKNLHAVDNNTYNMEITPTDGKFEVLLYLSVTPVLNRFADDYISGLNTNKELQEILKRNPDKLQTIRLFGGINFPHTGSIDTYYGLLSDNFKPSKTHIVGKGQAEFRKAFPRSPQKGGGYYIEKNGERYIVIFSPVINSKTNRLDVTFDFYSGGVHVDSHASGLYRAVARNFKGHTSRVVSLDVLFHNTGDALDKFTMDEQRQIIRKAVDVNFVDKNGQKGGTVVQFYNNTKMGFGALEKAMPRMKKFIEALQDTMGHLRGVTLTDKNIDWMIEALSKSKMVDYASLLNKLKIFDPATLSVTNLITAHTPLLRELYQVFLSSYVIEGVSHKINPDGKSDENSALSNLFAAGMSAFG